MSILKLVDDHLILKCAYSEKDFAKLVPHWKWNGKKRQWEYPFGRDTIAGITDYFPMAEGLSEIAKQYKPDSISNGYVPKRKLYDHQPTSISYHRQHVRCGDLSDMGVGKTAVAIITLDQLFREGHIDSALIVCPLSLVGVWEEEFEKFSNLNVVALSGTGKQRIDKIVNGLGKRYIFITNYEFVRNYERVFARIPFGAMVCDESSKIKNPQAKVSKAICKVANGIKYRMILTGVLTPNHPLEAFSQYRFLDPSIFGESWHQFRYRYACYGGYMNKEVTGYQNLDEFKRKLFSIGIRFRKDECLTLPEKIYTKRLISMNGSNRKVYDEMADEMIAEIAEQKIPAQNVLVKISKLQQITSGFITDKEGRIIDLKDNPKLASLGEFFDEIAPEEKVVIFFRFLHSIEMVKQLTEKRGWKASVLKGSVKSDERKGLIASFQNDSGVKLFLAQIKTGGIGLTLTASRLCVFYENPYSYGDRIQGADRLHRIGQKHKVTYIDLVVKNSIDERILKILQAKKNLVSFIQSEGAGALLRGDDLCQ